MPDELNLTSEAIAAMFKFAVVVLFLGVLIVACTPKRWILLPAVLLTFPVASVVYISMTNMDTQTHALIVPATLATVLTCWGWDRVRGSCK